MGSVWLWDCVLLGEADSKQGLVVPTWDLEKNKLFILDQNPVICGNPAPFQLPIH